MNRVAAAVLAALILVGCDSGDSRTTAQVRELTSERICIAPEDPEQTDLAGCFPIRPEDAARLQPGDCIDLVIRFDGAVPSPTDRAYGVKRLERECHVGRAVGFEWSYIAQLVALVAVIGAIGFAGTLVVRDGRRALRRKSVP
jgi:hypothetical protein